MTPEEMKHKVSLIRELYVESDQENNCVIATLRIKVQSGKIYAFNFMVNPVFGDIQSGKRPILDFFLFSQRMATLPEFLTTFNDTDPNDPIKTFGFAQNKEDFIHYKQTADIQLNTNQRVKNFIKIAFIKAIERVMTNKQFIRPLTNSINEQS